MLIKQQSLLFLFHKWKTLEKIHNLPIYKCEASRDLSVMKGLDGYEEKVKFKSHCRRKVTCEKLSVKIKRERSQSQFRL